jgi:hypothetical protein
MLASEGFPELLALDQVVACFQNWTSARERSYQPLPTMPWLDGEVPVR